MSGVSPEEVCVLLPTLNEAGTIKQVINGFQGEGFTDILVIDGGSTDGTKDIAESAGATFIEQSGQGKGAAIRESLRYIDKPYILMADGDGTYRPEDAEKMLAPLADGVDHVIGRRVLSDDNAMPVLNRLGNSLMNSLFRVAHGEAYKDILSGYRAFRTETLDKFQLDSDGFGIETEISVESVRWNTHTEVVDITYDSRPEDSESNLHPVRDGAVILQAIYGLTIRTNPVLFFGSATLLLWSIGSALAGYIGYEWVTTHVGHESLAVVSALCFLMGMQLLMFAYFSKQLHKLHRDIRRD